MPTVKVPAGMTPRNLAKAIEIQSLCDVSPDGDRGCPPSGWVNVTVIPYGTEAGPDPTAVRPDSAGQFAHPAFRFAVPQKDRGKRRSPVLNCALPSLPAQTGQRTELVVETDPGCYWIGTPCDVVLVGGTPGDIYDVALEFVCVRRATGECNNVDLMEPPFEFALTSWFGTEAGAYVAFPGTGVAFPQYHTHFEVVQGSARFTMPGLSSVVPLDSSFGPGAAVPLNINSNAITVTTGIYRTRGRF